MKQLEEQQPNHTTITGSHNSQHVTTATLSSQHNGHDTSTDNDSGDYMEKDSLCTSHSSVTTTRQLVQDDNMLISRSQLRKVLKAEIRKLLVTNITCTHTFTVL